MTNLTSHVGGKARNTVSNFVSSVSRNRKDLVAQLLANPFVGVNTKYPIICRDISRELFLFREPGPVAFDNTSSERSSYVARLINAVRVDDQHFIRPRNGFDGPPYGILFV